jgi:NAD(P) transhydrogenase
VGRQANSDQLNLESVGIVPGSRGKLSVNDFFQTSVPNIYAAGDVIGFPALASTSMEQGRLASCHMFGAKGSGHPSVIPYGIYTIPEVSMVGQTEEQLTEAKIPYEVGLARYAELAKGQMLGDEDGMLKLLFHPSSLKLLGVHAIGDRAAEIIHIGQAILALGGTIEYFRDTVFNYPTLAEAYKVAALDGLNKL